MIAFIENLRHRLVVKLFTIYLRYLIGFAFVFASIVKIRGERFTRIPPTDPVGYFFEAMYQTGFYWQFLGIAQCAAAVLLMTQRFATLGAMTFFPIIVNVFLVTVSINFGMGTPTITGLMLLATVYLLVWDYRKWMILFLPDHRIFLDMRNQPEDRFMNDPVWIVTGALIAVAASLPQMFGISPAFLRGLAAAIPLIAITGFVAGMIRHKRRLSSAGKNPVIAA